jgi:hypothetical protein
VAADVDGLLEAMAIGRWCRRPRSGAARRRQCSSVPINTTFGDIGVVPGW